MARTPRSRRLPLRLPVRYRARGERRWHHGTTASVSTSGAVIVGDGPRAPNAPLVVAISLPASDGCLTACARIVRHKLLGRFRRFSLVVAVRRFRIERRDTAFTRLDAHC